MFFKFLGFQQEAFAELQAHAGNPNYQNASLAVDGMSLKELSEFDPHIKRIFGKVDFGGEQVKNLTQNLCS